MYRHKYVKYKTKYLQTKYLQTKYLQTKYLQTKYLQTKYLQTKLKGGNNGKRGQKRIRKQPENQEFKKTRVVQPSPVFMRGKKRIIHDKAEPVETKKIREFVDQEIKFLKRERGKLDDLAKALEALRIQKKKEITPKKIRPMSQKINIVDLHKQGCSFANQRDVFSNKLLQPDKIRKIKLQDSDEILCISTETFNSFLQKAYNFDPIENTNTFNYDAMREGTLRFLDNSRTAILVKFPKSLHKFGKFGIMHV